MSTPEELPFSNSNLSSLTTSLGVVSTGVIVHKNKTQIIGSDDEVYNSTYVHDELLNDTQEISRESVTMESDGSSANFTMGVLHTNSSNLKSIEPIVKTSAKETTIKSFSTDGLSSANISFDSSGMFWNTDDSALYFSENRTFRIRYISKTDDIPSRLLIEGWNSSISEYVIKHEITSN